MIPKLYDSFDTVAATGAHDFIGSISHCRKCLVTEKRNSEYTLELETTVNDPTAGALLSQRIIAAKPNHADPVQFFEIQSTERSLSGIVTASAKHVKSFACQLVSEGDVVFDGNIYTYSLTPQGVWNKLFNDEYIESPCPFTFYSDISALANCYLGFNEAKTLGAILGGEEGSLTDMFSGEFHYDNYNISFLANRGKVTNYKLRYGQNISSATQKESCAQAYSHILPCGTVSNTNGRSIHVFSPLYSIPNSESKTTKVFILDCTDAISQYQIGITGEHYNEVRAAMTAYAERYAAANSLGKTAVSIEVTTRAELDAMQKLGLCDTVKVVLDSFGITTTAKITSATYNTLLERWEKMTVGISPVSLTDIILNKRKYNI